MLMPYTYLVGHYRHVTLIMLSFGDSGKGDERKDGVDAEPTTCEAKAIPFWRPTRVPLSM